ncbi:hypothetical protein SAMN05660653_01640 [Desulfonatronum thiosulfatophilum]|uniref:Tryptophan synthase subunit beta like protein n=1 Tax=Desulfonatronum thiosulfatophilum TaxID=617002 RepID=A0A1G6CMI7_9BACT|nr:hypothetical protein [Desulfonatronum thiosulfatophilum]SDB34074.1 hypothetical protein SAMN05660653_01640 [Desulfonatronum thiosulfatophilum]
MLYVERDTNGIITAIHNAPKPNVDEVKHDVDDELLEFLHRTTHVDTRKLLLSLSDMGMIRLVEDLIDLLINKNVILYTELPEYAQEKIRKRKLLRETVSSQTLTVDDIL